VSNIPETFIHPGALVHPDAQLDVGVRVGPFSIIGSKVRIGAGTVIGPHALIEGNTTMGKNNRVFQFATLGSDPQDLKYKGEDSRLIIGDGNTFRECCTVHKGTEGGIGETRLGNGILVMAYAHVAHDCVIRDRVIMANGATLAGHIDIEEAAIIGGLAAVHQFCRVGTLAMVAGGSIVVKDVAPYCTVQGNRAEMKGLNLIGLQRRGFSEDTIDAIKSAHRIIFRSGFLFKDGVEKVETEVPTTPEVQHLVDFLRVSERGFIR